MPINSIEYNQRLTSELDKALVQKSVTGFLADNALRAKFVGAKTVLIPEVGMQGLGDYDRDTGFLRGSVSVTNTPYTLSKDRGRSFQIDAEDADETGISDLIGKVSAEFVRTRVIPELDAYVLSKLGGFAANENATVSGDPATQAYTMLQEAINRVQNVAGYDEELVAFVSGSFWADLQKSTDINRYLVTSDFKRGEINSVVKTINGVALLPVQDERMRSSYIFNNGAEEGQTAGGFTPAANAKKFGFIVMPKNAAHLVKKTEKTRIFSPKENLNADAWKMDYRVYYDVFVKTSYTGTIFAYVHD